MLGTAPWEARLSTEVLLQIAPLRPYDEMHLIAALVRIGGRDPDGLP